MKKPHKYWSWMPWMRWFVPLSVLLWYSKRTFGRSHVWYQDEVCQLELTPRFDWAALQRLRINSEKDSNGRRIS